MSPVVRIATAAASLAVTGMIVASPAQPDRRVHGGGASARPGSPTALSALARGRVYGGSTAQDDPIVVDLAQDGRTATRTAFEWEATCASKTPYEASVDIGSALAISARGGINATVPYRSSSGSTLEVGTTVISARVSGKRITGSLYVHRDLLNANPTEVTDACDLHTTFTATSRKNRIYGGVSSQDRAVVIERSTNGRNVNTFRIGWQAPCEEGGFAKLGDVHGPLAVGGQGAFGDDYTFEFDEPSDHDTFDYSLHGRINGAMAGGSFSVHVTQLDKTSGNESLHCDTGLLSWSAASG